MLDALLAIKLLLQLNEKPGRQGLSKILSCWPVNVRGRLSATNAVSRKSLGLRHLKSFDCRGELWALVKSGAI